jgi:hypothetical protein
MHALCFARHGFINFGLVAQPRPGGPSSSKGTIVIVGAGLAGLAAARQLLVRARNRCGACCEPWALVGTLLTRSPRPVLRFRRSATK